MNYHFYKLLSIFLFSTTLVYAQNVNIPDANFKAALVANTAINTNGDGEIQVTEAEAVTGFINVANKGISDMTGIEAFVNMTQLLCGGNSISSINISALTSLTELQINNNNLTSLDVSANIALTKLHFQFNNITSIDLSSNTALVDLFSGYNPLTSIDVSNNTALKIFYPIDNDLTALDVTALTNLEDLRFFNNSLTTVDLSNNTSLTTLHAYKNQLSSINLSANTALVTVHLNYNPITSVDLSALSNMQTLGARGLSITSLDLSANNALKNVDLRENTQLSSVNLKNGNNSNITSFRASSATSLVCVTVDHVGYSVINWTDVDDSGIFKTTCNPDDIVSIPDTNFKTALLANATINTTDDGEITYGEAEAYTGTINFTGVSIADATGLEAFFNITEIDLSGNSLTSIDVSNNTKMTKINVENNSGLGSIDVSSNLALKDLFLQNCGLASLDVTANTSLRNLRAHVNNLTSLDISNNTALTEILLNGNPITSIDLSNNINLINFWAKDCPFTSLDFSNNPNLASLWLQGCTELTTLDLSSNSKLTNMLRVDGCSKLTFLDLRNRNNTNLGSYDSRSTPLLSCIAVDDPTYSTTNWTNVDAATTFSYYCDPNDFIKFKDANFKTALTAITALNTNSDGEITYGEADVYTGSINIVSKSISDLSEIIHFPNITGLNASINSLNSIDVSKNTKLTSLRIGGNNISSIDVSANTALTDFIITDCPMASVDITNLTALTSFTAGNNQLSSIDLSKNSEITVLSIYNQSNLTSVDVSSLTKATNIGLWGNALSTIDLSANTAVKLLYLNNNSLSVLDLSKNTDLVNAQIHDNQIASLDLSANAALQQVNAKNNALTAMNIANGANASITAFDVTGNPDLTCITVDDPTYSTTNWTNIDATASFSTDCRMDQTITFNNPGDQIYEDGTLTLSATSTSGLTVTFEVVSGPATVNGTTLTFTGMGTVVIKALQVGDASYKAATPVEQTFDIITITSVDLKENTGISIYPNPAQTQISIDGHYESLQILDLSGRILRNVTDGRSFIDIGNLKKGHYLLLLSKEEKTYHFKLLKN